MFQALSFCFVVGALFALPVALMMSSYRSLLFLAQASYITWEERSVRFSSGVSATGICSRCDTQVRHFVPCITYCLVFPTHLTTVRVVPSPFRLADWSLRPPGMHSLAVNRRKLGASSPWAAFLGVLVDLLDGSRWCT